MEVIIKYLDGNKTQCSVSCLISGDIPFAEIKKIIFVKYYIFLYRPSFDKLDFSKCINLESFYCQGCNLQQLPSFANCKKLKYFNCANNYLLKLPELPIAEYSTLKQIICYNNKLTHLPDLSRYAELTNLICYNNLLTDTDFIDLYKCKKLTRLNCSKNRINFFL